jgi:hypothetical protein
MTEEVGRQKRKGQMQMWTVQTLVRPDRGLGVRLIAEEGYGKLFGGTD